MTSSQRLRKAVRWIRVIEPPPNDVAPPIALGSCKNRDSINATARRERFVRVGGDCARWIDGFRRRFPFTSEEELYVEIVLGSRAALVRGARRLGLLRRGA